MMMRDALRAFHWRMLAAMVVLFLTGGTNATQHPPATVGKYDPLASWLWNLTVTIPDQHFKEGIFHLAVLDMKCTHFALESINSTYVPSNEAQTQDPSLDLVVSGISATCNGKYRSTGLSGKVSATVKSPNPKALSMDLIFASNNSSNHVRMATSVSTEQCQVDLKVSELHFSGSISAKIINLFKKPIRGYVSDALSTQVCPALKGTIDGVVTKLLKQIDDYLLGLLPKDTDNSEWAVERSLKRKDGTPWKWSRDAPLAVTVLRTLNVVLDRYLDQGLFLDLLNLLLGVDRVEEDCGYFFHGINGLVHQLTNGAVEFAIPDALHFLKNITVVIPKYASVSIRPKTLGIAADRFDELTLLQPNFQDESFWTKLNASQGLNLTATMDIQVSAIPGGAFSGDPLVESFQLSINTTSLDVSGNLTLDLNNTSFHTTTMNHVISAIQGDRGDLGCSLQPLESFGIQELLADVGVQSISIVPSDVTLRGSLELDIDGVLNSFLSLFLTEYDTLVTLALGGLLNGPVKKLAQEKGNEALQNLIANLHPTDCEISGKVNASDAANYVNFSQAAFLQPFNQFLNNTVGGANNYLECISHVLTSHVEAMAPRLDYLNATLQLQSLEIEHAGSIESMELFLPQDNGYHLANGIEIGSCDGNVTAGDFLNCTGPSFRAMANISVPFMNASGAVNLTARIGSIQESVSALMLYDINKLRNLSLADLASCHACFAKPAAEAALYAAPLFLKQLNLAAHVEIQGDSMNEPVQVFVDSADFDTVASTLTSTVSWVARTVVESTNKLMSHLVDEAEANCDFDDSKEKQEEREQLGMILTTIVYLLPFYILSHILYIGYNQVQSQGQPANVEPLLEYEQHDSEPRDGNANALREKDASLLTKESIPSGARHLFPVVLIVTIAVLIASNLSVGASVDLVVSTKDVQSAIRLPSLFAFSLGNTIREMYHAGIYVLLFIVVVFSGIWPYLKLLMMLWAWMAPESIFSTKKRGKLLFSLDALSKFSLVDTFVLVIMMVSFRFHLGDSATIDVFVNPRFGFYGFLVATTASLLAGHVELHTHRRCMVRDNETNDATTISLFSHRYSCRGAKYTMSGVFKMLLVAFMTAVVALLSIGSIMESFTFEFGGLAGALLGSANKKSYSLITIGTAIPESVEDSTGPGIMFLQVVYFFYATIMPGVCLLALFVLMVVPLRKGQQELWLTVAEIANAWSAIEVFALSIVAALFEISTFASFIVGDKCDLINQLLEHQFDDELHGDDICYSVTASVGANVAFLLVGVILNSWVVTSLLRIAQVVVDERANPDTGLLLDDDDARDANVVQRLANSILGKHLFVLDLDVQEPELATPLLVEQSGNGETTHLGLESETLL